MLKKPSLEFLSAFGGDSFPSKQTQKTPLQRRASIKGVFVYQHRIFLRLVLKTMHTLVQKVWLQNYLALLDCFTMMYNMPMDFEGKKLNTAKSGETKENNEIRQEITHSIDTIKKTALFNPDYLDNLVLISFEKKKTFKFEKNALSNVSRKEFDMQDFMQGKRMDFVGINPKKEFESHDMRTLEDKPFLPLIFIEGKLSYDEFVTHEIAHNLFDNKYTERVGQYKEADNITDVSEEYREKIKNLIIPLVKKHYPNIKVERFSFSRQQIAEIFTMLYEREFCRRANNNTEMHSKVKEKVDKFSSNPEKILAEFNEKNSRHCKMNDFYEENHILSLVVSHLLEKEYPEFSDRVNIFWK